MIDVTLQYSTSGDNNPNERSKELVMGFDICDEDDGKQAEIDEQNCLWDWVILQNSNVPTEEISFCDSLIPKIRILKIPTNTKT